MIAIADQPGTTYQIDDRDRIVHVDAAWDLFCLENGAPELSASHVLGRDLWDFINDESTRYVYRQMIFNARGGRPIHFEFRCDSPDRRRLLEMRLTRLPNQGVQFQTTAIRTDERPAQQLLSGVGPTSDEMVTVCSWCCKFRTGDEVWNEAEDAVSLLKLFDSYPLPLISHGMCSDCYSNMSAKIAATIDQ